MIGGLREKIGKIILANVRTGMMAGENCNVLIVWSVFNSVMAGSFHNRINRCQSLLYTLSEKFFIKNMRR